MASIERASEKVAPRVGCVQYLNARPLIHGLSWEVRFGHPGDLCHQLADGNLDVGLVSSFELFRNPIYTVVDDVCVASRGPVYSVFVAHTGKLSEVEEIEIDPASLTSVSLLRCLLEEAGLFPKLVGKSSFSTPRVNLCSAKLLIGDQAIRFRRQNPALQYWDLGEAWESFSSLPFVYALWLIRPEVSFPEQIGDSLRRCRDCNLADLDSVIAVEREFSREFCADYFRKHLRYYLGEPEREGLALFRGLCLKHGILPS